MLSAWGLHAPHVYIGAPRAGTGSRKITHMMPLNSVNQHTLHLPIEKRSKREIPVGEPTKTRREGHTSAEIEIPTRDLERAVQKGRAHASVAERRRKACGPMKSEGTADRRSNQGGSVATTWVRTPCGGPISRRRAIFPAASRHIEAVEILLSRTVITRPSARGTTTWRIISTATTWSTYIQGCLVLAPLLLPSMRLPVTQTLYHTLSVYLARLCEAAARGGVALFASDSAGPWSATGSGPLQSIICNPRRRRRTQLWSHTLSSPLFPPT